MGLCIAIEIMEVAVRAYVARKSRQSCPGSVADLVRCGQLRSDRRSISRPFKYEDPFNNPLVKVGKSNSTVDMCGKLYRLAPVTLNQRTTSYPSEKEINSILVEAPVTFLLIFVEYY